MRHKLSWWWYKHGKNRALLAALLACVGVLTLIVGWVVFGGLPLMFGISLGILVVAVGVLMGRLAATEHQMKVLDEWAIAQCNYINHINAQEAKKRLEHEDITKPEYDY